MKVFLLMPAVLVNVVEEMTSNNTTLFYVLFVNDTWFTSKESRTLV